jgi:hypothetical protein
MKEVPRNEGVGLAFMFGGFFLCCTCVGAIIGLPMIWAGWKSYTGKL